MPFTSGARLGVYEIVGLIGEGGMGLVYRALDTKLGRSVAIKVLPDAVRMDPERVARFEREARMLAALNHPHIAQLYGMEQAVADSAPLHFLIMELVEGETLADLLRSGALPLDRALDIALQTADALEAAHERGVIHRDLKPANVKLTPEGKVLLFSEVKGAIATLKIYSMAQKTTQAFGDVRSVSYMIAATFSPDGQWVAYTASNNTGENFVYVQPFPPQGTPYQISQAGENGHHPLWSPNGSELLYVPVVGQFVARRFSSKPAVSFGNPVPVPRTFPTANPVTERTFDMAPDGRVLSVVIPGQGQTGSAAAAAPIQVVLNWTEELKSRVPVR